MSALPVKRRKIKIVLEDAQEEAEVIISMARNASRTMVNILGGILGKDPKGKYDTLTNFSKIAGKDSKLFTDDLDEAIQQFKTVLKLLDDIEAMESGR